MKKLRLFVILSIMVCIFFMLIELFWIIAGVAYVAGVGMEATGGRAAERAYIASRGFNKERQYQLERMSTSADRTECMAFERLCGYIPHGEHERKMAVREISIREGWRYYDTNELFDDPAYVKLIGGKYPDWCDPIAMKIKWKAVEDKAKEHIAEVDRRKAWIARCEHGDEVHVFPMNFATEALYRAAVAYAYRIKVQSESGI